MKRINIYIEGSYDQKKKSRFRNNFHSLENLRGGNFSIGFLVIDFLS